MNHLIAEPDVLKRSAYVSELHQAFLRNDITPSQMVRLQHQAMPWCEGCRADHSVILVDGKHTCLTCYQHTTEA